MHYLGVSTPFDLSFHALGNKLTTNSDAGCVGTGFSFNESPGASSFPSWINDKSSSWKCVKA
ncbi:hypothetical protein BGZ60DRAFT_420092 [Tricladium varicosporioides]|nr:hypothetical protein BGZ60DRAFT_420092 [Hymenoscyphus varicosporioides]